MTTIAPINTKIHQTSNNLPAHVPKGGYAHHPPDGGQLGDSLRGDPLGEPPFNPHVGYFGWPTPSPRMFIPPWY